MAHKDYHMSRFAAHYADDPLRLTIAALIVFLLMFDFLAPVVIHQMSRGMSNEGEPLLIGLIIGLVVGQIVLLSLWGAFGAEPFTKRIPRAMSLLISACLAWLLGFRITDPLPIIVSFGFALTGLIGFLLLMSPMFALRRMTGMALSRVGESPPVNPSQFGIRNILIWTTVIAVQMSLAKLIAPNSNRAVGNPGFNEIAVITGAGLVCGFFVAAVGIPIAFAILGTTSRRPWVIATAVAACVGPPLTIECISILVGSRPGSAYVEMLIAFGSTGLGVLVVVSTVLGIVRAYGYRMHYRNI